MLHMFYSNPSCGFCASGRWDRTGGDQDTDGVSYQPDRHRGLPDEISVGLHRCRLGAVDAYLAFGDGPLDVRVHPPPE